MSLSRAQNFPHVMLQNKVEANFLFLLNFYATFAAEGVPVMSDFKARISLLFVGVCSPVQLTVAGGLFQAGPDLWSLRSKDQEKSHQGLFRRKTSDESCSCPKKNLSICALYIFLLFVYLKFFKRYPIQFKGFEPGLVRVCFFSTTQSSYLPWPCCRTGAESQLGLPVQFAFMASSLQPGQFPAGLVSQVAITECKNCLHKSCN